jgi:hypothetical protein
MSAVRNRPRPPTQRPLADHGEGPLTWLWPLGGHQGCDSVEGGAVEDVFDTTGRPPKGWMHAVFHGGPYGEDVGRCVPGPPAAATHSVPLPEGGVHVYRLWTVGSWSDPDDPVAVYNPTAPRCRRLS